MSRPRTSAAIAAAIAATLAAAPAAGAQAPAPVPAPAKAVAELKRAGTFELAIGAQLTSRNVARLGRRDLVVVDGEEASRSQVAALRRRGAIVLGYLSVGSVEGWRSWAPLLEPYGLGSLAGWEGERYADLTQPAARAAIVERIAPQLLAKGFDGLFLDNLDVVDTLPAQLEPAVETVARLSALVRGRGGVLMAQNTDSQIARFAPYLDAWNREDPTGTYDFERKRYALTDVAGRRLARATMRELKAAGLLVTTTDYFASATTSGAKRAVRIACQQGAVPFVGEITLSKVAKRPVRCR